MPESQAFPLGTCQGLQFMLNPPPSPSKEKPSGMRLCLVEGDSENSGSQPLSVELNPSSQESLGSKTDHWRRSQKSQSQCFPSDLSVVTSPLPGTQHLQLKGSDCPENPDPPDGGPLRLQPLPGSLYQLSNLCTHSDTQLQEMKTVLLIDETLDKITWF